jgi:hypothetical protein
VVLYGVRKFAVGVRDKFQDLQFFGGRNSALGLPRNRYAKSEALGNHASVNANLYLSKKRCCQCRTVEEV